MVKWIVVTGAAGFIGSGVVKFLNDKGVYNLILVDDIEKTDKWKNLLHKKSVDFLSRHELFDWLEGRGDQISAFLHLGACSDTLESDGDFLMQTNFRYTVRLAEYALKHQIRFIYASSAATYGNGELGFTDDHEGLESLKPLNLYGFSKYYFDLWAKQNGVLDQLVGLKYFNVFGPNENHKGRMASMVYKMVPLVQKEGVIRLFKSSDPQFKDGDQRRDFIYVKDAVRMSCAFLDNLLCGIFNIGSGQASSWNALAGAVFKALDKPIKIEYIDMPNEMKGQYQNYTCASMEKYHSAMKERSFRSVLLNSSLFAQTEKRSCAVAQEEENPLCQFSLEEGVRDYVKNYLLTGQRW
jgi:ADP-L-glycero-D-manno-heptose 6-epimerase